MRVIQYSHVGHGGHWTYAFELASAIGRQGHGSYILSPRDSAATLDDSVTMIPGITPPDVSLHGVSRILNRARIYHGHPRETAQALRDLSFGPGDVIHVQSLPSLGARRFVRTVKGFGCTAAITVHNTHPHAGTGVLTKPKQRQHSQTWNAFDTIIVHSEFQREALAASQIDPEKIHVVPHPVWPRTIVDQIPTREYLMFGTLRENKGISEYIRALAELGDPPATLAGSGPPSFVAQIESLVKNLGLNNLRLRTTYIDDSEVPRLFADHAVLVLPYQQFDAQSGVLNLAISFDRPALVSNVGAMPELVRSFGVGNVYSEDLADHMSRTKNEATDGVFRQPLASARQQLSADRIARQTVEAYIA